MEVSLRRSNLSLPRLNVRLREMPLLAAGLAHRAKSPFVKAPVLCAANVSSFGSDGSCKATPEHLLEPISSGSGCMDEMQSQAANLETMSTCDRNRLPSSDESSSFRHGQQHHEACSMLLLAQRSAYVRTSSMCFQQFCLGPAEALRRKDGTSAIPGPVGMESLCLQRWVRLTAGSWLVALHVQGF